MTAAEYRNYCYFCTFCLSLDDIMVYWLSSLVARYCDTVFYDILVGIIIIIHAYRYTELYFCLLLFIGGKVLVILQSSSETQWSHRFQWLSFIQRKYQTNVGGEFFMFLYNIGPLSPRFMVFISSNVLNITGIHWNSALHDKNIHRIWQTGSVLSNSRSYIFVNYYWLKFQWKLYLWNFGVL